MKNKTQTGITLIALIITIVILLILAVVSIGIITGEGIILHAKSGTDQYAEKSEEENQKIHNYADMIVKEIGGVGKAEVEKIVNVNSTINGEEPTETNPVIPAGFMAKNTPESTWNGEEGPEVEKGLVVSDGVNEFVWIPVPDVNSMIKGRVDVTEPITLKTDDDIANLQIVNNILQTNYENAEDFLKDLKVDFEGMTTSIGKYHGFYIGRYETSLNSQGMPQSVPNVAPADTALTSANKWYGFYAKQKLYSTSSVQGSMIWGSQFMAVVSWFSNCGIDVYVATPDDPTIGKTVENKTGITGGEPQDRLNNIYDLLGSLPEWTMEGNGPANQRVYRGLSGRGIRDHGDGSQAGPWGGIGSRLAVYVK